MLKLINEKRDLFKIEVNLKNLTIKFWKVGPRRKLVFLEVRKIKVRKQIDSELEAVWGMIRGGPRQKDYTEGDMEIFYIRSQSDPDIFCKRVVYDWRPGRIGRGGGIGGHC